MKRFVLLLLVPLLLPATAPAADDLLALAGLKDGKAIFDVRTDDPAKPWFILKVIQDTHFDLVQHDVDPDFTVSMSGPTVELLLQENLEIEGDGPGPLHKVSWMLVELEKREVRLEACGYAARMFRVDPAGYFPEVRPVGNSLNSLIGYQMKGYALVPMN